MEIVRNPDGSLVVPVVPVRVDGEEALESGPTSRVLHPGEGGYDEALAEWDLQQNPDREPVVSTASGREQAMHLVHEVAETHDAEKAIDHIDDPHASGEALRHVLVGGVHAVEDFAKEVAEAEGGDVMKPHEATKVIGEVLAVLD